MADCDLRGLDRDDSDPVPVYQECKFLAKQGDADAEFKLGLMHQNGLGVPQNDMEAFKWVHKSARRGNADAQSLLGWYYENGIGVTKNSSAAFKWYRKSAEQGFFGAQHRGHLSMHFES